MYKSVDAYLDFPKMERELLAQWEEEGLFAQTVKQRQGSQPYIFYDGPPFATGLPHYGHILVGTIKDAVLRYQTMCGYYVERQFGWDCHGLPVEYEVEKQLSISGKREIESYGVDRFNEVCRGIVQRYTKEWQKIVERSGRWVDFENGYKTMDTPYMESIWWVVNKLWQNGLIYKGYSVLPYCPRCSTVLSNHELNLGGYRNVDDPAIFVRFKLIDEQKQNVSLLAWTTTPWTLIANQALAVSAELDYIRVRFKNEEYIVAEVLFPSVFKDIETQVVARYRGEELCGWRYQPLFPYYEHLADQGCFEVLVSEHVSAESGSGIVHIAPAFGEEDYELLRDRGCEIVLPVDAECRYTEAIPEYEGQFVKDADAAIIARLRQEGKLFRREQINHSYPHCWRCESALIYRAISSWFVHVVAIKDKILQANRQIAWNPQHLKDGRFGQWLENARDWTISRNRYWGNAIPIWQCPQEHYHCISSRAELKELSGVELEDLHKHFVDKVHFPCPKCGEQMQRIPEVLDCWFESGAMPYAQNHYPFENKEKFEEYFPAHFINESLDQTRGWFYTLVVLAAALFERPPFKQAVVSGMVLASDGKKMSKSAKNYTDPTALMEEYGADAMRLYLLSSSVMKAEPLRFSDTAVRDVLRTTLLPLWNAYSFFVNYANQENLRVETVSKELSNPLDQWIFSELAALREQIVEAMSSCSLASACKPLLHFADLLNNWYIRRSRRRFSPNNRTLDRQEAFATLWQVLIELMQLFAPFAPFFSDRIYRGLRNPDMPPSVHLSDFPQEVSGRRHLEIEVKMHLVRQVVSLGRALRASSNIKNRQPLSTLYLISRDERERAILYEFQDMISEELNVKNMIIRQDETELVRYEAKANFKVLGKLLGADMKAAAARIAQLKSSEIAPLLEGFVLSLDFPGKKVTNIELTLDKIDLRRHEKPDLKVNNEGSITLAFDMQLSKELLEEGFARDFIRMVQQERKARGLAVQEKVDLLLHGSENFQQILNKQSEFIEKETASKIVWSANRLGDLHQINEEHSFYFELVRQS